MDWNDVRFFLALARTGSVRAAGASLRVSHSTVARRVEALEEQLSARLFDRSRDGYVLTEAGQQMLEPAERIEHEMAGLERGLVGRDERLAGPVSLTCSDAFVSAMIFEELAPLCAEYPEIELSVAVDARPFDLAKREADIAVRALPVDGGPPSWLIGRKVVPIAIASYVAVAHADRLDPDRGDGPTRWIAYDDPRQVATMIATSSHPELPVWGSLSSLATMQQAVRAGLGIAMLPCYVGDADPTLCRLRRPDVRHPGDLWLLSHPDLRDTKRLQATRERVFEALRRHEALFAGQRPHGVV